MSKQLIANGSIKAVTLEAINQEAVTSGAIILSKGVDCHKIIGGN